MAQKVDRYLNLGLKMSFHMVLGRYKAYKIEKTTLNIFEIFQKNGRVSSPKNGFFIFLS